MCYQEKCGTCGDEIYYDHCEDMTCDTWDVHYITCESCLRKRG